MRCPHCGSFDDKVIESRTLANGESIRDSITLSSKLPQWGQRIHFLHVQKLPDMVYPDREFDISTNYGVKQG